MPCVAERGQRARGPGEAHQFDPRAHLVQPRDMRRQRLRPDRAFQPERHRQRVLQMGAPGHHRVAVPRRLRCQRIDDGDQFGADQRQPIAHLQHRGAVHDVLRRRAPMRPAAGLPGGARQAAHQADHRVADIARAGGQFVGAQVLDPRRLLDGLGGGGGDDAKPGLHFRQRGLDIQHPLRLRRLVEHRPHGVAAVQRAHHHAVGGIDRHQTSRNTVSPAPCRRRSSRQVPGPSGCAISVPRRPASSIEDSSGSVAFSASPSK